MNNACQNPVLQAMQKHNARLEAEEAAAIPEQVKTEWCMTLPPTTVRESGHPINLLTIMKQSVVGYWCGCVGEFYSGWSVVDSLKHAATQLHNH